MKTKEIYWSGDTKSIWINAIPLQPEHLCNHDYISSVADSIKSDIYMTKLTTVLILHKNTHFYFTFNIY